MRDIFFITGTDTGVGKTFVACQLLHAAQQCGLRTLGLKPLAAGAEKMDGEWRNEDAVLLQEAATVKLPYASINPFCFELAAAPHLAAKKLAQLFRQKLSRKMFARCWMNLNLIIVLLKALAVGACR